MKNISDPESVTLSWEVYQELLKKVQAHKRADEAAQEVAGHLVSVLKTIDDLTKDHTIKQIVAKTLKNIQNG